MKKYIKIFVLLVVIISQSKIFSATTFSKPKRVRNVNEINERTPTPEPEVNLILGKAIADFDVEAIKLALENGADLNAKFAKQIYNSKLYWMSSLTWAIELLPYHIIPEEYTDYLSIPTVDLSSKNKFSDTLNFLIAKGRGNEINKDVVKFYTPLMHAIQKGRLNVARFLINNGVDVNFVTENGDSAFTLFIDHLFIGEPDILFCNYLFEKCNDLNQIINQKDSDYSFVRQTDITLLFYLTKKYSKEDFLYTSEAYRTRILTSTKQIIEMLIKNGSNIYFRDSQGNLLINDSKICDAELKDYIIKTYELHKDEIEARKKAKEKVILESIPKTLPETLDKLIISYLGFNNFKDDTEATDKANEPLNQAGDILVKDRLLENDQNK